LFWLIVSGYDSVAEEIVKKRYYGKVEYAYTVYSLNILKEYHEQLQAFLNSELGVDVKQDKGTLTITLG
jgi:hypothetical protein